ncbi:MAG: hypothetical protein V1668_01725 [Patescibacteria group bacterium]
MSSEIKMKYLPFNKSQKTVLLGAGIIFVVVIGIALVSFYYGKHQGTKSLAAVPGINVAPAGYQKVLGVQTASWQGKITKASGNVITFTITDQDNKSRRLSARVTDGTQLLRADLTKAPSASRSPAALSDFTIGSTIYVQGPAADASQSEFDAIAITLLIIPKT